jgi:succinate-acetate transporter protein
VTDRGPEMTAARVMLRPIANPLPLGFLALAAGTLLISGLQLGWLAPDQGSDAGLIILAFVFPLQLVASVFGYLGRDVIAGTGMGVLAGTWLAIALVTIFAEQPGATSDALGLFLLLAGTAMLVPFAAAVTGKLAVAAVLGTTALRFGATGLYQLTDSSGWKDVAGILGLILLAVALYAALALALEDVRGATVLPVGRRDGAAAALSGGLEAQVAGIEHAAGVRRQL